MEKIFNHLINIHEINKLPRLLNIESDKISPSRDYLEILPQYSDKIKAYVPISNGCNNFCTYCVVPNTRGREKSRSSENILKECKELIKNGYKEITLLGQNVNSYGLDLKNDLSFPELLQKVNDLEGSFWLRFSTSHPKDMSDELIEVIANNKNICNYIHLPVQSGNNDVLKKMNRNYTKEHYLELINKLKNKINPLFISTDIIVGFPGETKKQFKDSIKLFKKVKFDMAYISQYSPRQGTGSFKLEDNISNKEKKKRKFKLDKILKKDTKNVKFDIRFHLDPNSKIMKTLDNKSILIELEDEGWRFSCENFDINIDNGIYFGNKNSYIENQNIFISGISNKSDEIIKWEISKLQ